MQAPKDKAEALARLERSFIPAEQRQLREFLRHEDGYYADIARTYLKNPFLQLSADEAEVLRAMKPEALGALVAARDAATRSRSPRYAVFCMPKSGSSFIQTSLQRALNLPFLSLTSFGLLSLSSHFGMNSREQELDELALIRAVLTAPGGFVAQHHTRYSTYLGLQMKLYGIQPIVTVRNILDCIVSFDEMMLAWRKGKGEQAWTADAQFALPSDYPELEPEARYTILAHAFGTWLINFYLSWKRAESQGAEPLIIRYEDYVLDKDRLIELLAGHLKMAPEQKERLAAYVREPDQRSARLNVGRRGRGAEKVGEPIRRFLGDYARLFRADLTEEEIAYLVA
jgi:hypothetical protein